MQYADQSTAVWQGKAGRDVLAPAPNVALLRRHLRGRYGARLVTIETHFAWVLLTPRLAFKLKKPLCQWPMDYRTMSARRWGCEQELRLNRRLAPGVYLAVQPLVLTPRGNSRLGGPGRVVDYVVKMRRLPAGRMLDRLIALGLTSRQLERLIDVLARFFASADCRPMAGAAYLWRLRQQIEGNRRALRSVRGLNRAQVERVYSAQRRLLQSAAAGLAARGGRLVDGHGDLRAEHVQMGRTIQVIDCLEFDGELRRLDPMQELTLLALEIEGLGQRGMARQLLRRYCEYTAETIGVAELCFYVSHNAMTRAKLAGWHVDDPQFTDARPWLRRAESYMRQALRAARVAPAALPGTRKAPRALIRVAEPSTHRRAATAGAGG